MSLFGGTTGSLFGAQGSTGGQQPATQLSLFGSNNQSPAKAPT